MARNAVHLDDKYDLTKERIYVSGTQALVRLTLMQKARDLAAGHNTAGYVTGYRGSPVGALDQQFQKAAKVLSPSDVVFQTGINEDLAATALWGTQQAQMRGEGKFDGVFGIWYGKGPGVDRTGDAFRHANLAGTSPLGGVLALMGDDHTCESSTTAHQSEFAMVDGMMPILNPAGVQEILDFGLYGWALSRYSGIWAGLKLVKDNIESTASIDGGLNRMSFVDPAFDMPPGGINIRPNDSPLAQEARLHQFKLPAARAFLAANKIDQLVLRGGRSARIGVIATGKSHLDVLQALEDLGIDEVRAAALGLRLYKAGCTWPVDAGAIRDFAEGLSLVIVVEEKRSLIEAQIKEILYGTANAPKIVGKTDEEGRVLFQVPAALNSNQIGIAIGERLLAFSPSEDLENRVAFLRGLERALAETEDVASRIPYFCPGCPHNSSTHVPEGTRAYAGIGCHYMVQWMDRKTEGYTQMGGEGANWVGEAPFSTRDHVFQNIGDGTFNHSGSMAIRAAAASGVNITYKVLFNDAVAMTGGQRNDGGLTVPQIAAMVAAEGARRVAVVTDEPEKYPAATSWPVGTSIDHRDDLIKIERELAAIPGLTVLIYDQTCAAEKRRRRKRGEFPDPDKRVVINDLVCEGCGDCGVQSNCVAIQPLETEWGRKRQIDQSSCNKDFSCIKGFCPSFVTVHGARLKKGEGVRPPLPKLKEPLKKTLDGTYGIMITGVGGTGVVTVGAILGMAAHIEGKGCGIIDMAGLAQKGGAVTSHLKLAPRPEDISTIRIAAGGADLVIGCDIVVAGTAKVLSSCDPAKTIAVVNTHQTLPGDFTRNAEFSLPGRRLEKAIRDHTLPGETLFLEATEIAKTLFGDSIAANLFMLGCAYQKGAVPLDAETIEYAIELNGVAVEMNLEAFRWGRAAADDAEGVAALGREARDGRKHTGRRKSDNDPQTLIDRRMAFLTDYQDEAYAARYEALLGKIRKAEKRLADKSEDLARIAAVQLFRLMAIKDEYEVARLYSNGAFESALGEQFESWDRLEYHLAPPLVAKTNPETGRPDKISYGPRMATGFRFLAKLKRLRGTFFDLFGRTAERRMERQLLADYENILNEIADKLDDGNHAAALALAAFPEKIRGFGPVKEASAQKALAALPALQEAFREGVSQKAAAE